MNRRSLLKSAAALGFAAPLAACANARGRLTLDPAKPDERLLMYRKILHATDDRLVFWWMKLTRYAQIENGLTPLWNIIVGNISRTEDHPEGGYVLNERAVLFYTDLETGKPLERWKNPWTGETIEIRNRLPPPNRARVTVNGVERAPDPPTLRVERRSPIGPVIIVGDEVWVKGDMQSRSTPVQGGVTRHVNDLSDYQASLADVLDPRVASAPARKYFADVIGWQAFMNMGDRPGGLVGRGPGGKVFSIDDMPDIWRTTVSDRWPEIVRDPRAALAG